MVGSLICFVGVGAVPGDESMALFACTLRIKMLSSGNFISNQPCAGPHKGAEFSRGFDLSGERQGTVRRGSSEIVNKLWGGE